METYRIRVGEKTFEVDVEESASGQLLVKVEGKLFTAVAESPSVVRPALVPQAIASPAAAVERPKAARPAAAAGEKSLRAPMPGVIRQVLVKAGEQVIAGQKVAVMEAMKMENDLLAPLDGKVKEIAVQPGATVATGDLIMSFE